MEFERAIPGPELFLRKLVDTASLLHGDLAAPHGSDHRGLATDDPPLGLRIWELLHTPSPSHRVTRGRVHQTAPGSTGCCLAPAGPAPDRTGRKDSCMPAASLVDDPPILNSGEFSLVSRSFHARERVVINYFDFPNRALTS